MTKETERSLIDVGFFGLAKGRLKGDIVTL